jgi:hypothetical protein
MKKNKPIPCSTTEEISQMLIGGVEEIIGQDDLQALLKQEGILFETGPCENIRLKSGLTFDDIKKLEERFEEMFGENGCRGAALRTGRSFFQNFFQKHGMDCGLNSLEYRMQPLKKRILHGLEALSSQLSDSINMNIRIGDDEQNWYWILEHGDWCRDINGGGIPVSDFSIGLLQAYLSWASGGKAYPIQKNIDLGPACVIEIGKKALG